MIFSVEITNEKTKRIIQPESVTNVEGLNAYLRHFLCYNKDDRRALIGQFQNRKVVKAKGRETNERFYSIEASLIDSQVG